MRQFDNIHVADIDMYGNTPHAIRITVCEWFEKHGFNQDYLEGYYNG